MAFTSEEIFEEFVASTHSGHTYECLEIGSFGHFEPKTKALDSETLNRALVLLVDADPSLNAADLAKKLNMTASAVRQRLQRLGYRHDHKAWRKGRQAGNKHGATLTAKDVGEIKDLLKQFSAAKISRWYGVARPTISDIKLGRSWR